MADSLLDALNASLDGVDETDESVHEDTDESTTDDTVEDLIGDGSSDEGEAGDEGADSEEEVGEEGEEAGEEGVDGAPAAKAAADPKAVVQPKAKDPVNDPIPKDLKAETRERMTSLVSAVKNVTKERDAVQGQYHEIMGYIQETKATPQQYGDALNYLKMVNSGDPAQMQQALTTMQGEVAALAKLLGVVVPGVDMLADHKDLQEAIDAGTLTQQHAQEIAAGRERQKVHASRSQHQQQVTAQGQQEQQAREQGKQSLNELGRQLAANDTQFAAKHAILKDVLKTAIAVAHPSQWARIYQDAYSKVTLPAARVRTNVPVNQPMRAKTRAGQGNVAKAPSSMLDALNGALGA